MRTLRLGASKEEKVAAVIGRALSDFTIDLEAVGFHLAHSQPHVIYSRAVEVLDSAQFNHEATEYNTKYQYYQMRLFEEPAVKLED